MKNHKKCMFVIGILSAFIILLSYISFFPDSSRSVFKAIPVIKSIDQLAEQNSSLLLDIGKKDELIKKLEQAEDENAIMESKAIEFIIALFNNDMNKFKYLCTENLYKELEQTAYIDDVEKMTETQRLFHDIEGKKITCFNQIIPAFRDNNGYTVIVHFASNDFEDGTYIDGVFNFIEYKGKLLISFFGRDA